MQVRGLAGGDTADPYGPFKIQTDTDKIQTDTAGFAQMRKEIQMDTDRYITDTADTETDHRGGQKGDTADTASPLGLPDS